MFGFTGLVSTPRLVAAPPAVSPRPIVSDHIRAAKAWRRRQFWKNLFDGSYFVPLWARLARKVGLACLYGELHLSVRDGRTGEWVYYGLAGRRVVTTAGVNYLASCFDNTAEPELFKFHGFGTGSTAEATGDTALVTELTTQYATDNTRPTGSQAHSTNTYTTVGTLTPDADCAITEHGVFSATSSTTLWDRTKFSAINLVAANPDSLQATYVATFPAGG